MILFFFSVPSCLCRRQIGGKNLAVALGSRRRRIAARRFLVAGAGRFAAVIGLIVAGGAAGLAALRAALGATSRGERIT